MCLRQCLVRLLVPDVGMAPEVFTVPSSVDKTRFAKESDVFSCEIILHYILSGGKHPFSPKDCTNKNAVQVSLETETNIMNGNMNGWDNSLCPEGHPPG